MNKSYSLLTGLLFLFFYSAFGHSPYHFEVDKEEHPILIKKKLMLVTAQVNGREGFFLLDTGVSRLILNSRIFGEDSQESIVEMLDVAGVRRPFRKQHIESFAWGALHRENFAAHVVELEQLERLMGIEVLGLIGYEVLKGVEIRISYGARRLALYRLDDQGAGVLRPATAPDHRIPFRLRGHLPGIRIAAGVHESIWLGVDSGSALNVLNLSWKKRLSDQALGRYKIRYNAALSSQLVDYFTLPSISIAEELSLVHSKFAFINLTHFWKHALVIDGLLGIDLFRLGEVAINYRKGQIALWVHDNVYAMKYRPLKEVKK